jgi:acyl-CoA oxidase
MPDCLNLRIHGGYAQTEIGHGSNVQGLQTTATFDKSTDEFILNTPTNTAYKFWPGEMGGKLGTHAVVFARLIIGENDYGVHIFLTPIRDMRTHKPFPGIEVGDIGPKIGWNFKDNGYLGFEHFRIPRENMLMKYTSVNKEGEYNIEADPTLLYTVILIGRIDILKSAPYTLSKALAIAIRYACVRTQFKDKAGSDQERALIDYQTHQNRLFPLLSASFAMLFTANELDAMVEEMNRKIAQDGDASLVREAHSIISGLKAFYSWMACDGMETARQCCGGAGFSLHGGIAYCVSAYSPMVTLEGDNTVMA